MANKPGPVPGSRRGGARLAAGDTMTHEDIQRTTGISRERVRQIEQQALWKLKHALATKGLGKKELLPD